MVEKWFLGAEYDDGRPLFVVMSCLKGWMGEGRVMLGRVRLAQVERSMTRMSSCAGKVWGFVEEECRDEVRALFLFFLVLGTRPLQG